MPSILWRVVTMLHPEGVLVVSLYDDHIHLSFNWEDGEVSDTDVCLGGFCEDCKAGRQHGEGTLQ